AGILVQEFSETISVRRCRFVGPHKAITSRFTAVLGLPSTSDGNKFFPPQVFLFRIEDCEFSLILFGVVFAGELIYAWVSSNVTYGVHGALILLSVMQIDDLNKMLSDPKLASAELAEVIKIGLILEAPTVSLRKSGEAKLPKSSSTLSAKDVVKSAAPYHRCLTLLANQFDCRPIPVGERESTNAVVLGASQPTFATLSNNMIWNRSSNLPTVIIQKLAGFN